MLLTLNIYLGILEILDHHHHHHHHVNQAHSCIAILTAMAIGNCTVHALHETNLGRPKDTLCPGEGGCGANKLSSQVNMVRHVNQAHSCIAILTAMAIGNCTVHALHETNLGRPKDTLCPLLTGPTARKSRHDIAVRCGPWVLISTGRRLRSS